MTTNLEGHTLHSYDEELKHIHKLVVEMAELVLEQTRQTLHGFSEQDFNIANAVIEKEHDVDSYEVKVDEEIIATTARRSPVAKDLRIIMSLCKSVTDLERIGDEAAKISHLTKEIFDNERADPSIHLLRDISVMGNMSVNILQEAVIALKELNLEKATQIFKIHSELDKEFQSSVRRLSTFILEDSRNVGHAVSIVLIIKALERIGDHAKNIAEYIIYLVKGMDVRHTKNIATH